MNSVFKRTEKYVRGLLRANDTLPGADSAWWDAKYESGISDSLTIGPNRREEWIDAHYAAIERLLERDLLRRGLDLRGASILDVGSGAGHWVRWALDRGADRVTATDISQRVIDHLLGAWSSDDRVTVVHGSPAEADGLFDATVAVGVMFHIIDDDEWTTTIRNIAASMRPGAWLAMTGMFGRSGYADVQVNNGVVTKRLRPYRRWRRELKAAGFGRLRLRRNRAWLRIPAPMPEAHLLTAIRTADGSEESRTA